MKTKTTTPHPLAAAIAIAIGVLPSALAEIREGHGPGNGGGIHLCDPNSSSTLPNVFYDLYALERTFYKKRDPELARIARKTPEEIIANRLEKAMRTQPQDASRIVPLLKYFDRHVKFDRNVEYPVIRDASIVKFDQGCAYAMLGIWEERSGFISVHQERYDLLTADPEQANINVAAFRLHETAYKLDRIYNEAATSDHAQQWVVELFSEEPLRTSIVRSARTGLSVNPAELGSKDPIIPVPVESGIYTRARGPYTVDFADYRCYEEPMMTVLPPKAEGALGVRLPEATRWSENERFRLGKERADYAVVYGIEGKRAARRFESPLLIEFSSASCSERVTYLTEGLHVYPFSTPDDSHTGRIDLSIRVGDEKTRILQALENAPANQPASVQR